VLRVLWRAARVGEHPLSGEELRTRCDSKSVHEVYRVRARILRELRASYLRALDEVQY
jgi:hypothetical protein